MRRCARVAVEMTRQRLRETGNKPTSTSQTCCGGDLMRAAMKSQGRRPCAPCTAAIRYDVDACGVGVVGPVCRGSECGSCDRWCPPSADDSGRARPAQRSRAGLPMRHDRISPARKTSDADDPCDPWCRVARSTVVDCAQAACRACSRAAERAGARACRPRCVRILSITGCSRITAMIFSSPPQFGQCSRSSENTASSY